MLDNVGLKWRMCAGLDWGERSVVVPEVVEEETSSGSKASKPEAPKEPLTRQLKEHIMLRIQGLSVSKDTFADDADYASRLLVLVQNIDILDRVSARSHSSAYLF